MSGQLENGYLENMIECMKYSKYLDENRFYSLTSKDLDTVIPLLERDVKKKVITNNDIYKSSGSDKVQYTCPHCNQTLLRNLCTNYHKPKFCYKCGGALSEEWGGK